MHDIPVWLAICDNSGVCRVQDTVMFCASFLFCDAVNVILNVVDTVRVKEVECY